MNYPSVDLETENRRLREQVASAQKGLQDFVYAVSHDLGVPLRAVTSFSLILEKKYAARMDQKTRAYLAFIAEGGAKAQAMLAGLLQYSRLHTHAKPAVKVDLNATFRAVCGELKDKITYSSAVITCEKLPVIWAEEEQMRQLFYVVIDNALTYCRPGISPALRIEAGETADAWRIAVSDNGIGIPEKSRERAFQVFKRLQTDETYPGIGMGLPIARRIVERHRGAIGTMPGAALGTLCWFTLSKDGPEAAMDSDQSGADLP